MQEHPAKFVKYCLLLILPLRATTYSLTFSPPTKPSTVTGCWNVVLAADRFGGGAPGQASLEDAVYLRNPCGLLVAVASPSLLEIGFFYVFEILVDRNRIVESQEAESCFELANSNGSDVEIELNFDSEIHVDS